MSLVFTLVTLTDTFYFPLKINVNTFKDSGSEGFITSESTMTKLFMKECVKNEQNISLFSKNDSNFYYTIDGEYTVKGRKLDVKMKIKGKKGFEKDYIFKDKTYKEIAESTLIILKSLKRSVQFISEDTLKGTIGEFHFTTPSVVSGLPVYDIKAQFFKENKDTTLLISKNLRKINIIFADNKVDQQVNKESLQGKIILEIYGPSDTRIYVNGEFKGYTPLEMIVQSGEYNILFDNPVWGIRKKTIKIPRDKKRVVVNYFQEGEK